ncbi:hypothetical protein [Weissella halotolerans]|uniref:Uncharacterized protein n=1 Tax=Weissella halotolerans DSM 20190 TaxID=1123500 RepID=A0A0R2FW00_9LACO|nr:hypothetical protein [Weissella halotolerans]KRN32498.1 hypothetical protein IV68_GL000852 [Weissella halotolerans DSM 20190]
MTLDPTPKQEAKAARIHEDAKLAISSGQTVLHLGADFFDDDADVQAVNMLLAHQSDDTRSIAHRDGQVDIVEI